MKWLTLLAAVATVAMLAWLTTVTWIVMVQADMVPWPAMALVALTLTAFGVGVTDMWEKA